MSRFFVLQFRQHSQSKQDSRYMYEEKPQGSTPLDPDPVPLAIGAPSQDAPPANEHDSIRKDLSEFERVSADVQKKNLAATRAIAIVTGLYMLFAALQWWTMRRQLAEMHGTGVQTDKLIAAANAISDHQKQIVTDNKQALADNKTAIESTLEENREELAKLLGENQKTLKANLAQGRAALDASINASRLDQRAWVGIRGKGDVEVSENKINVVIHYSNSGKTPALNFRIHGWIDYVPVGKTPPPEPQTGSLQSTDVLYPEQVGEVVLKSNTFPDQRMVDSAKAGNAFLFVHLSISYEDIFRPGRLHKTTYCGFINEGNISGCNFGNHAD